MVYENTHLWAAEQIKSRIKIRIIEETIVSNLDYYHLGAIFPDVLFYSRDPGVRAVAYFLHGETGVPTNEFIFEVLDPIREMRDEKNLAFIWGFLTHCALDIVFHPVVIFYSGYDPEDDRNRQLQCDYLHLHIETIIDRHFNKGIFLENIINPTIVNNLLIPPIQNITRQDIKNCLKRQIFYFRLIHSRLYYIIFKVCAHMGLVDKRLIAGFYANLKVETRKLPEKLNYRDIISGSDRKAILENLMEDAVNMAVEMVEAAYNYYMGRISKESCKHTIAGKNLDTGRVNKTRADIRFSLRS
ncbi:MAG: zinc dependent phospholipase C family protein [bacterium]|nr:zinc dependent phospholipase C family protein [bacterium]